MPADLSSSFAVVALLLLPLLLAAITRPSKPGNRAAEFALNAGRNGPLATFAGAVSGNIGIGSFVALFLFTGQSPVLGFSIALAYSLGLVLCAALAGTIRKVAGERGTVGLIDLVAMTEGRIGRRIVFACFAFVFVLRSAIQLAALGLLTAPYLGVETALAVTASGLLIAVYLLVGGYRAAVETDIVQAGVILVAMVVCMAGLSGLDAPDRPFFTFGEYRPALLAGVWLFIPWSAVLAVDNWQRITLARSDGVAQVSYLAAALVCGLLFWGMAYAGYASPPGAEVFETYARLAPEAMPWIATVMFVACIMSSIDTFIMALVVGGNRDAAIGAMRIMILVLTGLATVAAILFGDLLSTVVAAFNSLAVFLPAALGALFLSAPGRFAAPISMSLGLIAAIAFTFVDVNSASLVGFCLAALSYGLVSQLPRKI
ncbi:hypothetical protein [Fulvimarina sp. MAC3]|uniref:sodium:solute symporter family transporter n=1 Tax=Fulvimarina sp. MAC3 TaxID=3148887 RepID=UPI0031FD178E